MTSSARLQNLASSLNGDLGFASIATLYGVYCVAAFLAAPVVRVLTAKYSMVCVCVC